MAETLVKSVPAAATGLVLRLGLVPSGVGFGGVERWVVRLVVVFKASCWVLREQARVGVVSRAWSCRRDCLLVGGVPSWVGRVVVV